jgi:hypothetical protein
MIRVTREKFFATVGQLNVHPRVERDASYWETPARVVLGITTPGYLGAGERTYSIDPSLQSRKDEQ